MSGIPPVGERDYTRFSKEYYDHKDTGGQNSPRSKITPQKQKIKLADPLPTSFFSSLSSSSYRSSSSARVL